MEQPRFSCTLSAGRKEVSRATIHFRQENEETGRLLGSFAKTPTPGRYGQKMSRSFKKTMLGLLESFFTGLLKWLMHFLKQIHTVLEMMGFTTTNIQSFLYFMILYDHSSLHDELLGQARGARGGATGVKTDQIL